MPSLAMNSFSVRLHDQRCCDLEAQAVIVPLLLIFPLLLIAAVTWDVLEIHRLLTLPAITLAGN